MTVLIRRHRTHQIAIHIDDRLTIRTRQLQHDTGDTRFAVVLAAVTVLVEPDEVADRDLLGFGDHESEVERVIALTVRRQALRISGPLGGVALTVTFTRDRRHVRLESLHRLVLVDRHRVRLVLVQHRQIVERVMTVLIRRHRTHQIAIHIDDRLTIRTRQLQHDTGDTRFAVVLAAVTVLVEPDEVTDRDARLRLEHDTGIPCRVDALRRQDVSRVVVGRQILIRIVEREHGGQTRLRIGVRVETVVVAGTGLRELVLRCLLFRQLELHLVVTSFELVEQVEAVLVRRGGGDFLARTVEQRDLHTRQHLVVILQTVAVGIDPDEVTHRIRERGVRELHRAGGTVLVDHDGDRLIGPLVASRGVDLLDRVRARLVHFDVLHVAVGIEHAQRAVLHERLVDDDVPVRVEDPEERVSIIDDDVRVHRIDLGDGQRVAVRRRDRRTDIADHVDDRFVSFEVRHLHEDVHRRIALGLVQGRPRLLLDDDGPLRRVVRRLLEPGLHVADQFLRSGRRVRTRVDVPVIHEPFERQSCGQAVVQRDDRNTVIRAVRDQLDVVDEQVVDQVAVGVHLSAEVVRPQLVRCVADRLADLGLVTERRDLGFDLRPEQCLVIGAEQGRVVVDLERVLADQRVRRERQREREVLVSAPLVDERHTGVGQRDLQISVRILRHVEV